MEEQKKIISGGMGFGYGSKYQLLRMLGWHRNFFNEKIANSIGSDRNINWIDFEFSGSEDKEIINAKFLSDDIENEWENIWPTNNGKSGINWDAIGTVGETYILVEAKAHLEECGTGNNLCGGSNPQKAIDSINSFQEKYNIKSSVNWLSAKYYQLANRLIFTDFLLRKGINAKLVYLLFVNGYEFNTSDGSNKSVKDENDWKNKMDGLILEMGIGGTEAEKLINLCYVDCNP